MKRTLLLLLCLCLLFTGCAQTSFTEPGIFYYHRTATAFQGSEGVIAPETRELAGISDDLNAMLSLYCEGPRDPGLESPLPSDAVLLGHTLSDQVLTLRFNESLSKLSGVELTVAVGCLARTFLPLTGAGTLVLTADGAFLNGDTSLKVTLDDLNLQDDSLNLLHAEFPVYYASSDRRYLMKETISVRHTSPEELPMYLLEQLLTPPAGTTLRSPLPSGTQFNSITVENGLCTVDVSAEFDNRRFYAMSAQCISLLSIVNTLTALEGIDRVVLTVEGRLLIRYGALSIPGPLVMDERCVGPVRTALGEMEVILYLVHGSEGQLIGIPARLRPGISATIPELVIKTLMADPGTNGIRSCIPAGTRLLSARVDDGICTVDLSTEYLNQPENLDWSNRVLVSTLCALDGVMGVKILVNGTVPADFKGQWTGVMTPLDSWFL